MSSYSALLTLLSSLIAALAGCIAGGHVSMLPMRGVMASRIVCLNI